MGSGGLGCVIWVGFDSGAVVGGGYFLFKSSCSQKERSAVFFVFVDANHESSQSSEVVSFFCFVLGLEDIPADQSPIVLALRVLSERVRNTFLLVFLGCHLSDVIRCTHGSI